MSGWNQLAKSALHSFHEVFRVQHVCGVQSPDTRFGRSRVARHGERVHGGVAGFTACAARFSQESFLSNSRIHEGLQASWDWGKIWKNHEPVHLDL